MCAKALCQEEEEEPRILCVPRLYARKKNMSHVSYVCQGLYQRYNRRRRRRRKRATYLTCVKAICLEEEEEEGDSQRVVLDPHVMENLTWIEEELSKTLVLPRVCCVLVLETMEKKRVLDTHMPRCPTLWANKRKKYSVDTHCSLFTVQDMMLF